MTGAILGIALVLPWIGAGAMVLAQRRRGQVRARLLRAATAHLERKEEAPTGERTLEAFPWITWLLTRLGYRERLDGYLRRNDLPLTAGEYVACLLTLWIAVPLLASAMAQPLHIVVGAVVIAIALPRAAVNFRQGRRVQLFRSQLPDALETMISSLRAGHGLQRALQLVSTQAEAPLATELRRALGEVSLGSSMDAALQRVSERMQSKEMDLLATVIGIQAQIGGNLGEILERVAETLRDREELGNEIKALTAEGRLSAWVCMGLPPLMGFLVWWVNPEYMQPLLTTQIGWMMIGATAVMQFFGAIVIKKMMKIED